MLGKTKIKYIQSLAHKKSRDEALLYVAEGPKIVQELIQSKSNIEQILAVEPWIKAQKNLGHYNVTQISNVELQRISKMQQAHDVIAIVKKPANPVLSAKKHFTIMLDHIQDPGNMGTLLRIADWFGLKQIVCSNDCADIYNPKVVQASMGSIVRVQVQYTDLLEWVELNKDVRLFAATLEGKDVRSLGIQKEGILVIGNESKGINPMLVELANIKITIPGKGKTDSLNAAVATGIILSHIC